uniref:Alpha-1-antitrypsin homolog n=1 Tax=Salarias fasciatus TaxID=181472 RepID=A0A672J0R6_SALFA
TGSKDLSEPNAEFALTLYKKLDAHTAAGKNIFYSPISISAALSMVSSGARGDTRSQLMSTLGYRFQHWTQSFFKKVVDLSLPKFSISAEASLEQILEELGVTYAFSDFADFSGLSEDIKLVVSKVSHQAVLSVDETGTEAAAATTVELLPTSLPKSVKLNRPFLVFIVDSSTESILFMGKINNPTAL